MGVECSAQGALSSVEHSHHAIARGLDHSPLRAMDGGKDQVEMITNELIAQWIAASRIETHGDMAGLDPVLVRLSGLSGLTRECHGPFLGGRAAATPPCCATTC